jgi:hypothetical protein
MFAGKPTRRRKIIEAGVGLRINDLNINNINLNIVEARRELLRG